MPEPTPLRFYFDFASPYAYFALKPLEALAKAHGRIIDDRPMLIWAVLKAHQIAGPLVAPVKRSYLIADMERSAAFYGVPYRHPETLPTSSHLAARLYYAIARVRPDAAQSLKHTIFDAFFVRGEDITSPSLLYSIAISHGLDPKAARAALDSPKGRRGLTEAVDLAIADQVCGSPYVILDGEGFFGADRLPQLDWRLSQSHERQSPRQSRTSHDPTIDL